MALKVDAAAPYDPLVFCIGFFVVGTGLIITQSIRDEGVFLKARIGPPFNLLARPPA